MIITPSVAAMRMRSGAIGKCSSLALPFNTSAASASDTSSAGVANVPREQAARDATPPRARLTSFVEPPRTMPPAATSSANAAAITTTVRVRVRFMAAALGVEPSGAPAHLLVHDERRERDTRHQAEADRAGDGQLE